MAYRFDSRMSHNGCLSLFELKDLTHGLGQLSMEAAAAGSSNSNHVNTGASRGGIGPAVRPKQFRFRKVMMSSSPPTSSSTSTSAPSHPVRMLLPALRCEDETSVGSDLAGKLSCDGIAFIINDDSKVRVLRDRRTKEDLRAAFQDVDESVVNEVWNRTKMYAAASTILSSLRNNGHTGPREGEPDLQLECPQAWPALEDELDTDLLLAASLESLGVLDHHHHGGEMSDDAARGGAGGGEGGWEHVDLPDGDQWVLVGEGEEDDFAGASPREEGKYADSEIDPSDVNLQMEREIESMMAARSAADGGPSSSSLNYREALVSNLMEIAQGGEWPAAPIRALPAHVNMPWNRRKAAGKGGKKGEEDTGDFLEEYYLSKAVSIRTRKSSGRKRLTPNGKLRMAAKNAKRVEAATAAGARGVGGGDYSDDEGGDW